MYMFICFPNRIIEQIVYSKNKSFFVVVLLIGVKYEQPRCQRNNSYKNNDNNNKVNDDIKINYL